MNSAALNLNIMQYPELILAFALTSFLIIKSKFGDREPSIGYLPTWLTGPCIAVISYFPERYLRWLVKLQLWSGWRSNTAYGALATLKILPVMASLLTAIIVPSWAAILMAIISFFVLDVYLVVRSRKRKTRIKESLPQALDLMVLCVDAGLGLDATINRLASEETSINNDLNTELKILSRDILLGLEREKAYQDLYERTGVDELKSLGSSLNQAANIGISISKILRSQSEFLRTKLSQKAEERAAKLPIYMAFPLWFCIMPALMVIVLAPSFITFFDYIKPLMFK